MSKPKTKFGLIAPLISRFSVLLYHVVCACAFHIIRLDLISLCMLLSVQSFLGRLLWMQCCYIITHAMPQTSHYHLVAGRVTSSCRHTGALISELYSYTGGSMISHASCSLSRNIKHFILFKINCWESCTFTYHICNIHRTWNTIN